MINLLANIVSTLLGIYLIIDAWMLISSRDSAKEKWCFKARYVAALMSGLCLVGLNRVLNVHVIDLVYAIAIGLGLWSNTFYTLMGWLQENRPTWYLWVLSKINVVSRRRS